VRVLHTADWHVGKAIRGRSRAEEHRVVLGEIAGIAERASVDLVIVGGDLFDTASPTPEAERIVYRALLDLAAGGRPVVVVAGNHDSAQRLGAVAPLSQASGIHVAAAIRPPDDGGVLELDLGGEVAQVALLPFPSQRYIVTADLLLSGDAADAHAEYADRVVRVVRALTGRFRPGTVTLVVAHLMVMGGVLGGGERGAHTVFDYWVPATAFPPATQYVALGHLHRGQRVAGPAPLHYSGSPLQLDFGETGNEPAVNLVDVRPGLPAEVRPVPLVTGRRLRTLRGSLAEVLSAASAGDAGGAAGPVAGEGDEPRAAGAAAGSGPPHLRVVLDEPARAGLADEVRERVPGAVEVVLAARDDDPAPRRTDPDRLRRTPHDLFTEYLTEHRVDDGRIVALFDDLVEQAGAEPAGEAP
jgi:exonuclease SbcD